MNWVKRKPAPGEMIRVGVGGLYHFGIYVSDAEVIQFGLAPDRRAALQDSEVEVLAAPFCEFTANGEAEVCAFSEEERKDHRRPEEVVAFARSKLGMKGYHILYNNCEHFANECVTGKRLCRQTEDVRALFRSLPVVDVYLGKLPEKMPEEPLACPLRQREVEETKNELLKRQRYYVWKLLGYGLERSLGKRIGEMTFTRDEKGFYTAEGVCFSLSHSENALAAAVSRKPVGVDVEALTAVFRPEMAERAMTKGELAAFLSLPEQEKKAAFLKCWTAKEALFKASQGAQFVPADWDTEKGSVQSFQKTVGEADFFLSVATETPEKLRIFENIELK